MDFLVFDVIVICVNDCVVVRFLLVFYFRVLVLELGFFFINILLVIVLFCKMEDVLGIV